MGNPFNNVYALLFIVVRVTIKFSEEKKYDMIKWQFQNVLLLALTTQMEKR